MKTTFRESNLLCIGKNGLDFVKFNFVVEGHQVDVLLGRVLDERFLLARIGINDSRRRNSQIKNFLYLALKNKKTALITSQSDGTNHCRIIIAMITMIINNNK